MLPNVRILNMVWEHSYLFQTMQIIVRIYYYNFCFLLHEADFPPRWNRHMLSISFEQMCWGKCSITCWLDSYAFVRYGDPLTSISGSASTSLRSLPSLHKRQGEIDNLLSDLTSWLRVLSSIYILQMLVPIAAFLSGLSLVHAAAPQIILGKTTLIGLDITGFKLDFFGGASSVCFERQFTHSSPYLGIPYTEPPIGNLRLRPPVLKTQLDVKTFDASSFGKGCLQPVSRSPTLRWTSHNLSSRARQSQSFRRIVWPSTFTDPRERNRMRSFQS